jgi:hypothetical protein
VNIQTEALYCLFFVKWRDYEKLLIELSYILTLITCCCARHSSRRKGPSMSYRARPSATPEWHGDQSQHHGKPSSWLYHVILAVYECVPVAEPKVFPLPSS